MKRPAMVFATALLGACYEFTGPAPAPNLLLSGLFYSSLAYAGADSISLAASNGMITGSGVEYRSGAFYSSFSISGQYSDNVQTFWFTIRYTRVPYPSSYTGQVWGADSLSGSVPTYTAPGYYHEVFYRLPVPPCANPAAAIIGVTGAPIAIVKLRAGVDPITEGELLGDSYGFEIGAVDKAANSFSAVVSAATAAVLRCEPSVVSVSYPF